MTELAELEQMFVDSEDESRDARERSEKSRDYYDNIQLTSEEVSVLKARKQPPVVFNRIAPKIDFLMGTERNARTDPKAFPRTPAHDEGADAATDAIRFVLDANEFDIMASDAFENVLIEGSGGCSVEVKRVGDEIRIMLPKIRWDRWFYDPHSLMRDYSDATYTGVISWKDIAVVKERWPHAAGDVESGMSEAQASETYDDKPVRWFNKSRSRVMCVDIYWQEKGVWQHAIYTKGVWLDKQKKSAYLDEDGLPENPQIAFSAKVKRDGQRYGVVEALIDVQDEINKRRSKSLHILTTKQTFAKEGQIQDINTFKKEANKPDGHLEFPSSGTFGNDFGIIPNESLVGPQFQMYQDAMQQMDTVSANAALTGKREGDLSGRAIQSLQQGGMVELTPLFDAQSAWKKQVYRAVWNRIRQFWREEKWIRVTDDEENLKFVGLNQPITKAEQALMDKSGLSVKEIRQEFGPELEQIHQQQPELAEIVARENDVVEMDVDIILEEVPDVVNLQAEQFDQLVNMYRANPDGIDWEDVVAMSSLRNKDKILNKDLEPEEQEAFDKAQEEAAVLTELDKQQKQADIKATSAKAAKDFTDAKAQDIENDLTESGLGALLEQSNV